MDEKTDLASLIAPVKDRMFATVWRILRHPQDAEDALQNALVTVWRRRKQVESHPAPHALILRICADAAIDHFRRRRLNHVDVSLLEERLPASDLSPLDGLIKDETLDLVMGAISRLSPKQSVRVDPKSGLPVEMRSTEKLSPNDPVTGWTLAIDYPDYGPSDIYAMGVPKDAAINDRTYVKTENGEEIKAFLAKYVQAQGKPLEPFSMTVLRSRAGTDFAEISEAIRGRDDGQGVQLEAVNPREPIFEISRKVRLGQITQPEGTDRAEWWKQQIAGMKFTPAQEFYHGYLPNRIGYPEELSRHLTTGLHLTKGPSLIDNPDVKVTLDRQPRLGPPGTVMLNIRVQTTIGSNDLFFWIAPENDYLVLRQEAHFTKDRVAWHNQTVIIDTVEQSPKGRWYATKARHGRIKTLGDDLPNEPLPLDPRPVQDREPIEIGPINTTMYRYIVSFTEK